MDLNRLKFWESSKSMPIREGGIAKVTLTKKNNPSMYTLLEENDKNYRVENFKKFKRAYDRVPLITAIIDVQADQVVQDFHFVGPNKDKLQKFADKIKLMRFFHSITKSMLLYGNAYCEVVKKGEEIEEMKVLNPIWMDVYRKDNGDVIGYSQTIENKEMVLWGTTGDTQEDSKFTKRVSKIDSIVHFKYNRLGSEKYGRSVVEPLLSSLQIKLDMESDLQKVIYKYVAPLIWAKVGTDQFPANDTVVQDISNTLYGLNAESEVTTSHLVDLKVLDFNAKGMDIQTPIKHIEQQIISGGHVPPELLGREGSDKATSEVRLRNFGRHIKSIQREVKYEFEDKIIIGQKLGTEEDLLVWEKAEEREWEIDVDILRGLVTDGILTPQKANDLLPPRFQEQLPELLPLMNGQSVGAGGQQVPRPNQMKTDKIKDNPNDPTQTTKDDKSMGKRVNKTDREVPVK